MQNCFAPFLPHQKHTFHEAVEETLDGTRLPQPGNMGGNAWQYVGEYFTVILLV